MSIFLGLDKDDRLNTDFESIFNPDGSLRAEHGLKADGAVLNIHDSKLSRYVKSDQNRFVDVEVTPAELFDEMKASQVCRISTSEAMNSNSKAKLYSGHTELKYPVGGYIAHFYCSFLSHLHCNHHVENSLLFT